MKLEKRRSTAVKTVFIVEDHAFFRETLVQLVSRQKDLVVCGEASEANEAFEAISRIKPDVVLVDITLPGKSGLALVGDFRAVSSEIKFLVVSLNEPALYASRALAAGANGYVWKQGDPEELIRAIRTVLNGRTYLSAGIG
jgi:DNA-binding NarL/FixJ family response regulator